MSQVKDVEHRVAPWQRRRCWPAFLSFKMVGLLILSLIKEYSSHKAKAEWATIFVLWSSAKDPTKAKFLVYKGKGSSALNSIM